LEKTHKKKCKELESAAISDWKLDYSQKKLALKEKHYQVNFLLTVVVFIILMLFTMFYKTFPMNTSNLYSL